MNYVLSRKPCYEFNTKTKLTANVWHSCEGDITQCVFVFENGAQMVLDKKSTNCNFKYKGNEYYILKPNPNCHVCLTSFKYQNKQVQIAVGSNLCLTLDGELLLDKQIENIVYKQYQVINNNLIIYFGGDRDFFVVIKDNKVLAADYYDDLNVTKNEIYILKRLHDSLNHGKVFCITDKGFDDYLVYLDDYELNLKRELMPCVMLDLVRVKNYRYACSLLKEDLRPTNAKDIGNFFLDFDDYLPLGATEFCLLKNDAFLGIVKFDLFENKICNITMM